MAVIVWKRNKTIKIVHFNNYFCVSCFKFSCLKRWKHYFPFNPHFIIIFYYIKVVTTLLKAVTKQNLLFCLKWIIYGRPPKPLEQAKETRQFPATILITNITTSIFSLVLSCIVIRNYENAVTSGLGLHNVYVPIFQEEN